MFRKPGQVLTLSLLVMSACHSSLRAEQSPAQVLIERAKLLEAQGRPDLAADNWRQVLLIEPRQPDGLAALIRYYRASGDATRAQQYQTMLDRVRPGAPTPSRSVVAANENADAVLREAARLAANHNYAESLRLYQQVFGSAPPPDSWGVAYYETEAAVPSSQAHAIAGLRALAQKYPANPSYQLALARVLSYHPATRLEGIHLLSHLQGSAAQNEEARAAWKQAILWDLSAPAAIETGKQYLERFPDPVLSAQLATAAQHTTIVRQASPLEGEGYKALAGGDFQGAIQRFTTLAGQPGHSAQGEAGLGYVSMKRKEFVKAVMHFEQAKAAGQHSPTLDKALKEARYWDAMSNGNTAMAQADMGKASAEFERARTVNADLPEASEALGGSLLAEKDPKRAEAVFADELKTNPDRPDAWIGWMNASLENGRADEMLARQSTIPSGVKTALARRPDYLALLASAELATGNSAAALQLLDRINDLATSSAGQGAAMQVRAADLLLRRGYSAEAIKLCASAIKADPDNSGAWQTLVQAEHAAGQDEIAARISTQMPKSIDAAAVHNPDFLLTLAAVYQNQQRLSVASRLLDQVGALEGLSEHNSLSLQLQRASLALAGGDAHKAYMLYQAVEQRVPASTEAWTGMVNALHAGKHDREALATIEGLAPAVTARLRHDPDFLQTAAFVYSENGHTREAMLCLRAVSSHFNQKHQPVPLSLDIEYAWLLLKAGNDPELAATLDRIGQNAHVNAEQTSAVHQIWAAWSIQHAEAEYKRGHAKQALAILQTAGQAYPERPELLMALAGMYVRAGKPDFGMKMYEQMNWQHASVEQFQSAIDSALAAHNKSYADAWLKLGLEQHPNDMALLRTGARMEEARGNRKKAEAYLQAAMGSHGGPGELSVFSAQVPTKPIFDTREGLAPLTAEPEASPQSTLARMLGGAPSAKAAAPDASELWSAPLPSRRSDLQPERTATLEPLSYEPSEAPEIEREHPPYLLETGFQAPSDRGTERNQRHNTVRPAWPDDDAPEQSGGGSQAPGRERLRRDVGTRPTQASRINDPLAGLGLDSNDILTESQPAKPLDAAGRDALPAESLEVILKGTDKPVAGSSLTDGLEAELGGHPETSGSTISFSPGQPSGMLPVISTAQQQASDELAALQSQYSPWLATGGAVKSHSGTTGFDQLQQYEAEIESSTVLAGRARITAVSRPVLLQSGIPDSRSNYRFGSGSSMPQTAQFASGLGAELQLATRSLQASIGISPSSFLISNVIGSLSVQPAHGPFTLRAYRSNIKDSLLSYAGMKDPDTGVVWGGVIATGGAIEFSHGNGDAGFYASVDGQKLTGRNVADNTRLMGNAGAYWLAYSNSYGQLKVGANLTAMHYALNERYFTIGQGGYFSPDGFLMANAPVTWEGRPMYQTSYQISGSLGAQNIQQGQAVSGSLITGNGIETLTSASYDLHARVAYRISGHWNIEGFLDTNNARQYAERSAGFTLRYVKSAQPDEFVPSGFMNQTDIRPLKRP